MKRKGFTLLEMLIVLGVIAILFTITFLSLLNFRQQQALRDAATQVTSALNEARSTSRRSSGDWQFVVSTGNAAQYSYGPTGTLQNRVLPNGAVFASAVNVTYTAPNGEINNPNTSFILKGQGGKQVSINLIGVLGKVVVRGP